MVLATIFIAISGELPKGKELKDKLYKECLKTYSIAAVNSYTGMSNSYTDMINDSKNFNYALIKSKTNNIEEIDLSDKSIYEVGSPEIIKNYDNYFIGEKGYFYTCNLDNLYKVLTTNDEVEYIGSEEFDYIIDCFYVEKNGYFVYKTEEDNYYIVPTISLTNGKNEEYYYWNGKGYENNKSGKVISSDNIDLNARFTLYGSEGDGIVFVKDFSNTEENDFTIVNELNCEVLKKGFFVDAMRRSESDQIAYVELIEEKEYYIVLSYVSDSVSKEGNDIFAQVDSLIGLYNKINSVVVFVNIFSIILFLLSGFYLCVSAGYVKEDDSVHIIWLDKIPVELTAIVFISIIATIAVLFAEAGIEMLMAVPILAIEATIFGLILGLILFLSIVRKIKAKCFFRYTFLGYFIELYKKKLSPMVNVVTKRILDNISIVGKCICILVVMFIIDFLVALILINPITDVFGFFGIILILILLFVFDSIPLIYAVVQMAMLQRAAKRIAEGNIDEKVDTSKMFWEFKKHGEYLNQVSEGINLAVNDKMKSERFRTELITNVSHDIKTPLTSIINYVDLIKKEDVNEPPMDEYIEVLDRQSARLKKLIEDLMEASKASTGNLEVNLEKCNVGVFVSQIVGEFQEKMSSKNLELIINQPSNPIEIMADGRHFWRVIDNLMNNIYKYAQPNTRVYVNIKENEDKLKLIFMNTSAYQLNITSEELMERFVRGDSSRSTEGSGLGLSIASSLTALMQGEMDLDIEGDLFKVTLTFDKN